MYKTSLNCEEIQPEWPPSITFCEKMIFREKIMFNLYLRGATFVINLKLESKILSWEAKSKK